MRSLNDWLAQQLAQHPKEIERGVDRVRLGAQRLGLLPWKHPTVIVGGTNGKGSTVATLTAPHPFLSGAAASAATAASNKAASLI